MTEQIYDAEFVDIPNSGHQLTRQKPPRAVRLSAPVRNRKRPRKAATMRPLSGNNALCGGILRTAVKQSGNPFLIGLYAFFTEIGKKQRRQR